MTIFCLSASAQIKDAKTIQLQKGQQINVVVTTVSDTDMGMGMQLKNNSENTNLLTVTGETDKEYILTNKLTKLKVGFEGMGQSHEYDSEKESDQKSEMGQSLTKAIGKSINVHINKYNGVSVSDKVDPGPEKAEANPMESMMSAFGGDEPAVAGAFLIIPQGKKAGDSWIEVDSTKDKKGTKTYTLKSVSGNVAQVTFTSEQAANTNIDANGNNLSVQMNIKSTGDLLADVATGLVSKRNSVFDISGTMEIQGQTLPITSKSNLTAVYTVLKN